MRKVIFAINITVVWLLKPHQTICRWRKTWIFYSPHARGWPAGLWAQNLSIDGSLLAWSPQNL